MNTGATAAAGGYAATLDPILVLDGIEIVLQPIIAVADGSVVAAEALARFPSLPGIATDSVFETAHASGYGFALEAASLRAALDRRADLPDGAQLSINLSPDVLAHPAIISCLSQDLGGVIIEVTEQNATRPDSTRNSLLRLRQRGARIAVDDVSTGYAGLLRLATLCPDYVKVDRQVITGVRDSFTQSVVLDTLVELSHRLGAAVIGEGVEDLDDLAALGEFRVDYAQGWAIGRPAAQLAPIPSGVLETCQARHRHGRRAPWSVGRRR